jgi:hypothetical protein
MSLVDCARIDGHDLSACLRDVLERLPTQCQICELMPHRCARITRQARGGARQFGGGTDARFT